MEKKTYDFKKIGINETEIIKELFAGVFTIEPWNDDWSNQEQLNLYLLDLIGQSNSLTYGLFENGKLIGVSMGHIKHWYSGTEYYIEELCIQTNKQGNGIGTYFLKEIEKAMSILDIAKSISEGLARMATAGEVNGEVKDLRYVVEEDCSLNILTFESALDGKKAYWHTTSHIMAQAVKRLFPKVKLAIGPAIDDGFYYDFDVEKPFTEEDYIFIAFTFPVLAK